MVFAAVMALAARLGGSIASGIHLPRGSASVDRIAALPVASAPAAQPISVTTRAEAIVRAIDAGDRRIIDSGDRRISAASDGSVTLAATRTIDARPSTTMAADYGNRLGQGYRRLAVAPSPASGT
jgi:hypothetical protein